MDDSRIVHQGTRDGDGLPLPAAQLVGDRETSAARSLQCGSCHAVDLDTVLRVAYSRTFETLGEGSGHSENQQICRTSASDQRSARQAASRDVPLMGGAIVTDP